MSQAPLIRDECKGKIRRIVAEIIEVEEPELDPDGHFENDYGADSLSRIAILSGIEKELNIVIPQTELPRITCLNNIYALIGELTGTGDE